MNTTVGPTTAGAERLAATSAGTVSPLSETQRYFLEVIVDEGFDPSWQHICLAIRLTGSLDRARVQDVAARLAQRHPVLCTRLTYRDGEPCLAPCADPTTGCEVTVLQDATERELDLFASGRADAPFDLLSGPLWRLIAVSDGTHRTILAFVSHHLVGDGISAWTLVRDFGALYFGGELTPAPPSYAEFVAEEAALLHGPEAERRLAYWEALLADAQPRLPLPGRPGPGQLGTGRSAHLSLPQGSGGALVAHARARRVTPLALLCDATFSAVRQATTTPGLLAGMITDVRGARFASTVGAFSDLMLVRDQLSLGEAEDGQLARLRNEFFNGMRSHLPVGFLRRQLPALDPARIGPGNPCDLYLNFIPVRTSSDWFAMMEAYADHSPEYHALGHRIGSPSRRFHAPLYFFSFVHAMELAGWVDMQSNPHLEALNEAIVDALQESTTAVATPPP